MTWDVRIRGAKRDGSKGFGLSKQKNGVPVYDEKYTGVWEKISN